MNTIYLDHSHPLIPSSNSTHTLCHTFPLPTSAPLLIFCNGPLRSPLSSINAAMTHLSVGDPLKHGQPTRCPTTEENWLFLLHSQYLLSFEWDLVSPFPLHSGVLTDFICGVLWRSMAHESPTALSVMSGTHRFKSKFWFLQMPCHLFRDVSWASWGNREDIDFSFIPKHFASFIGCTPTCCGSLCKSASSVQRNFSTER